MGILKLYSTKAYYQKVDPKLFRRGQICWIVSPNISPIPQILDVKRNRPEEHDKVDFTLKNVDPDNSFRASQDRTLPIKYLNLKSTEELLIQKAKKRLALIISSPLDIYAEISSVLKQNKKEHLQEDSLFLIPCYGTEMLKDQSGFPPEMVSRIRCLLYRQFFYLPPCGPFTKESIARLDRIQVVVSKHRAAIDPTNLCLSEDVLSLFLAMFMFCISGTEEDELCDIRSLVRESMPQE